MYRLGIVLVFVAVGFSAKLHDEEDLTKISTIYESSHVNSGADLLIVPFEGEKRVVLPTDDPKETRIKRQASITVKNYCNTYKDNYEFFCSKLEEQTPAEAARLRGFCHQYTDFCHKARSSGSENLPEIDSEEITATKRTPLPTDNSDEGSRWDDVRQWEPDNAEKTLLEAKKLHPCNPECNQTIHPHCTAECKCEFDKPKMLYFCTGPLDRQELHWCHQWFRRCPRQSPFYRRIFDAQGRTWPGREGLLEGLRLRG
ncbi:unnamed protein product, partial [Mesorhabditis spiculigera]